METPRMYSAKFFRIPAKRRAMVNDIALRHWKKLNRACQTNYRLPQIKYFKSDRILGLSSYFFTALNRDVAKVAIRKDLSLIIGHELCHSILGFIEAEILKEAKTNLKIARKGRDYIEYFYSAKEAMRTLSRLHKSGSHGFAFKATMNILGLKASRGMKWGLSTK